MNWDLDFCISLDSPIMNASGVMDTSWDELKQLAVSNTGAVVMKTCTLEPREGNPKPRYGRFDCGSIQAMGLPNLGYKSYLEFAEKLKKLGKPVVASVFGFNTKEYEFLVSRFQDSSVDAIEVNLSCPNADVGIPAYNLELMDEILGAISDLGEKPIGLKLPPYLTLNDVDRMARVIERHSVSYLTLINSYPTGLVIGDDERPIIVPRNGFGGLSGDCIKPIALANVAMFRKKLRDVYIIGVGGISSGKDVLDFFLVGADAVQIGTALKDEGISALQRIEKEFLTVLGDRRVSDIKGKALNMKYGQRI